MDSKQAKSDRNLETSMEGLGDLQGYTNSLERWGMNVGFLSSKKISGVVLVLLLNPPLGEK